MNMPSVVFDSAVHLYRSGTRGGGAGLEVAVFSNKRSWALELHVDVNIMAWPIANGGR